MTVELCRSTCSSQSRRYAGVQYSTWVFLYISVCSYNFTICLVFLWRQLWKTRYETYVLKKWFLVSLLFPSGVASGSCTMACAGNSAEICGDANKNSIYSTGTPPPPTNGNGYIGCYTDVIANRDLPNGFEVYGVRL